MTDEERKAKRFQEGVLSLSADEKRAVKLAMVRTMATEEDRLALMEAVVDIVAARARTDARKVSDRRTDARRRKLVGAHVPIETYRKCKDYARAQGISLYRFVLDALEREINRE